MKGPLNAVDVFCGAGGLTCGFKLAGFNTILGIDNDPTAIETFKSNNKESKIICKDITKITRTEIIEALDGKKIDLVIGGPPCQGFSMAGRRDPSDPRNSLFKDFLRIVTYIMPEIFVIENVFGLISMRTSKNEKVIDIIRTEAERLGYTLTYTVLNAANFGVPQKRKRVFIIGSMVGKFDIKDKSRIKQIPVKTILAQKYKIPQKYFYSKKRIAGFIRREKLNKKRGRGFGWQFLNPEKPSYTIPARYWKDGSDALIRYKNGDIRMLTPKECASIQSFPDSYIFAGSEIQKYKQIGNAVPPSLAKAVAKALIVKLYNSNQ